MAGAARGVPDGARLRGPVRHDALAVYVAVLAVQSAVRLPRPAAGVHQPALLALQPAALAHDDAVRRPRAAHLRPRALRAALPRQSLRERSCLPAALIHLSETLNGACR